MKIRQYGGRDNNILQFFIKRDHVFHNNSPGGDSEPPGVHPLSSKFTNCQHNIELINILNRVTVSF